MGNLAPSYICECNEDCNQGFSGSKSWSKPDKKKPQTSLPIVEQERALGVGGAASSPPFDAVESLRKPVPLLEDGEEKPGNAEQMHVDGLAADAEDPPPPPMAQDPEVPSQQETEAVAVDSPPTDQPAVVSILRFEVSVTKSPSEGFGLAHVPVEDGSNTLLIVALRDQGPIARWNDERQRLGDDEKTVRRGDRIVAVGVVVDDLEAMRSMLRQDSAVFTLERWPETIVVSLAKRLPTDKYGMSTETVKCEDGVEVLRVTQIWGGLMSEWNQTACQSRRFHEIVTPASEVVRLDELTGDPERIVELSGDPERMQQALMTRDAVALTFSRPDPSAFHK